MPEVTNAYLRCLDLGARIAPVIQDDTALPALDVVLDNVRADVVRWEAGPILDPLDVVTYHALDPALPESYGACAYIDVRYSAAGWRASYGVKADGSVDCWMN